MSYTSRCVLAALACVACFVIALSAQNYVVDTTCKATSLAGWHVLGDANWRAENGEYVGTLKGPNGGWLVSDKSLQDAGVFAQFRCTGGCKTGVLLRAEKTPEGMKGVYVALTGDEPGTYAVKLNPNLHEAWFQLGVLYQDQDKLPAAIREFERAVRLKTDAAQYHYRLGQAYLAAGRRSEADEQFRLYRGLHRREP